MGGVSVIEYLAGQQRGEFYCVLCGGRDPDAEMHGPAQPWHGRSINLGNEPMMIDHGYVHTQCGLNAGWEVS
jgi:hypothetical protein